MQWEFAYMNLSLGAGKDWQAFTEQKARIAALGAEGWEPVGQVEFSFQDAFQHTTAVPQLMFKRPVSEN